jgi:tetratricopeptide (TPR) repeat protein
VAIEPDISLQTADRLLREDRLDLAREVLRPFVERGGDERNAVVELAELFVESNSRAAALCVEIAADAWADSGDFVTAAAVLQEFTLRAPGQIPVLLRLVEICLEGSLDTTLNDAQTQLADAYLDAGRADEARVVAEDLVALQPGDPAHQERLRRARILAQTKRPAEPSAEVDLTDLLGELDGEPLADYRMENEGGQLDLARTYLEMGMVEDAIQPLIAAAHSTDSCFEASAALAGIYRERQDAPRAIEWYERAAASVAPSVDAGRALLYDLGDLLEMSGESARALAVFLEVDAAGPGYRDVAQRLVRLTKRDQGG